MENNKRLQIRLPETLLDKAKKKAKKQDVKLSKVIRDLLETYIK